MMQKKISRGLFLTAAVLIYLGAFVGPFSSVNQIYFLAVAAVLSIVLNSAKAVDQILITSIAILGIIPVLGWITIPDWFDPLQLVIAIWFYVIASSRDHKFKKASIVFSLLPVTIAPIFSFQWWKGLAEGDSVSVLTRILPIWDLSGHFHVFLSGLTNNTYIPRRLPPGENLIWAYRDYPAGIHYVWVQFAKNNETPLIENFEFAIPVFMNSLIVTMALSTLIASLCVWRLASTNYLRIAFSLICSGIAVALITLGPLSQAITTGFANIPPVVIALLIFLSFVLKPHRNNRVQLLILAASVMCMAYNWYPTLLLVAPVLAYVLVREIRRGRKWNVAVFSVLVGPLAALPLLQTLDLGISHLEEQGGVQPFPNGLLVTVLCVSLAVAFWAGTVKKNILALLINVPAPLLTLALGLWLRIKTDTYPYYFHKAALFIAAYSMFAILFSLTAIYDEQTLTSPTIRLHQKLQVVLAALLLGFGMSQMFGYWGLDYRTFSGQGSAYGVLNRNEFVRLNDLNRPTAVLIITQAKRIREFTVDQKSCSTLMIPSEFGVSDKNTTFGWKGPIENIWFHSLSDSLTTEAQQLAFMTAAISQVSNNNKQYVETIRNTFNPGSTCVISSSEVITELARNSSRWESLEVFTE
jgi:hypothetical protein